MPRPHQEPPEGIRLDPRLHTRLEDKQGRLDLIGQAVEAGLDFYLEACAAVPDEQYQLLADLALHHGYDGNYLGLLARAGKLEARKWDRRWYSTPAALARYEAEAQAQPRGRPPRHQAQMKPQAE